MEKPHSPSCERNKDVILEQLKVHFAEARQVLEVGSGTGQHAAHFAPALPQLQWQCSELKENLEGIESWTKNISNIPSPPLALDVKQNNWLELLETPVDSVFTANTLHIMGLSKVESFFERVGEVLKAPATLCIYGPFNYNGKFTSKSNEEFDAWLKDRDPQSGIRDYEFINQLAEKHGLRSKQDVEMPANNRLLVWKNM